MTEELIKEAARYLGYPNGPDATGRTAILSGFECLEQEAAPRAAHVLMDCRASACSVELVDCDLTFHSTALARQLAGCKRLALLCATLGGGVDTLLRRKALTSVSEAAVLQACAAALIEQVCDSRTLEIERESGMFAVQRFSPGYGDLSITYQDALLRLTRAERIGVSATEADMLAPIKSVTAVIGLADSPQQARHDCSACDKKDCIFRKETLN